MVIQKCLMSLASILVVFASGSIATGWQSPGNNGPTALVLVEQMLAITNHDVLSDDQKKQLDGVTQSLRKLGQVGLDTAVKYREMEAKSGASGKKLQRLDMQLDKIAGQKFSHKAQLFWHQSLDAAKAESAACRRPILSLRMLGNLDEDLSCANSRFFRTTLYPDPEIAALLRNTFVLHWQSVREVPIVTVDFGNGRKLRQPIIGNSVHLVLTEQGRVFDALPGLVSPREFVNWLNSVSKLHQNIQQLDPASYQHTIQRWHRQRAERRRSESPLTIQANQSVKDLNPLDPRWTAAATATNVSLDSRAHKLLDLQRPKAAEAMRIAPLKMAVEVPLLRMVEAIEPKIAHDSFFNLYGLQPKLDDWYTQNSDTGDYHQMTNRIYEELFLMPLSDPWLGLSPANGFAALDAGGRLVPSIRKMSNTTSLNPPRR